MRLRCSRWRQGATLSVGQSPGRQSPEDPQSPDLFHPRSPFSIMHGPVDPLDSHTHTHTHARIRPLTRHEKSSLPYPNLTPPPNSNPEIDVSPSTSVDSVPRRTETLAIPSTTTTVMTNFDEPVAPLPPNVGTRIPFPRTGGVLMEGGGR